MTTPEVPFVSTPCLFCRTPDDRLLYAPRLWRSSFTGHAFSARRSRRREHYRLVRCRACGLVRSDPIASPEAIHELYAESGFIYAEEAPYAARTYRDLLQGLLGDEITAGHLKRLVEIGCGTGFFLSEALGMGIPDVVGFEPSLANVEQAAPEIRPYIVPDIFRADGLENGSVDLVCTFHVLDHLTDPWAVLRDVTRILRPGGNVLIVCHDVEALTARLFGSFSPIFDVEHIYLFSQGTIARLLREAGLVVNAVGTLANTYPLAYWTRVLPAGARWAALLPRFLGRCPIRLRAGNLFALAGKPS